MPCLPNEHAYIVIDEFTDKNVAYILCEQCGEYRTTRLLPETPIPPFIREGMDK